MFGRTDSQKFLVNVMLAIALLAVAIPTCQMVGCEMNMCGTMMPFHGIGGPTIGIPCSGTWVASASQVGIIPTNLFSALVAMLAALCFAAMLLLPMIRSSRSLVVVEANAPPPPLEPRGERFIV